MDDTQTQQDSRIESRLTTVDNPYDPFTQWDEWYGWDDIHGYHTLSLLGRVVVTSHELSDADQAQAVEDAIDEIVFENLSGMHRKVSKDLKKSE